MDDVLTLVAQSFSTDTIGVQVATESYREIFCTIRSVTRAEWGVAGRNGFQPEFVAVTPFVNYNGEKICIHNGKRYGIYRTYQDGDDIELYCEAKAGI